MLASPHGRLSHIQSLKKRYGIIQSLFLFLYSIILKFIILKFFRRSLFFKKGWKIPRGKFLVKQKVRTKMPNHAEQLAQELNLSLKNVQGAIDLIDAGNTIPFIARYRKEATGSMDDQVLRLLSERLEYLRQLEERKGEIAKALGEQGVLSAELQKALDEQHSTQQNAQ